MKGRLFDIQRFSLDDGPGIRTIVFMKGCNLSCAWCHNPESIIPETQLSKIHSLCAGCGRCALACPAGAISGKEQDFRISRDKCTACGACVKACPEDSLKLTGYSMEPAEVLPVLLKDMDFYEETGGGVTFSGGEPLAQPEFLLETLKLCKSAKIHTAIETNGICAPELLPRVSPLLDYVMIDLKHTDEAKMRKFTGGSPAAAIRAVEYFAKHNETEARIPVIPGFNDTEGELEQLLSCLRDCGAARVTLLPYHTYGLSKYKSFGMDSQMEGVLAVGVESLQDILKRLDTRGMCVNISEK